MTEPDLYTFTILGCGSSGGVPRIGNIWGDCDPDNPRNRRSRCSLLVEKQSKSGTTRLIIDTGPDFRTQMLDNHVSSLDAVLYTHAHADHTHGINDLRVLAINKRERVDVYMDAATYSNVRQGFGYCFETPEGSSYPAILNHHTISDDEIFKIDGEGGSIAIQTFDQDHGDVQSLGFRIANVAYSSDVIDFPDRSLPVLDNLDIWIIDALRRTPHPSHLSLGEALTWIKRMKPKRAILTNMHIDLDYEALRSELPDHIEPAYDGLQLTLSQS